MAKSPIQDITGQLRVLFFENEQLKAMAFKRLQDYLKQTAEVERLQERLAIAERRIADLERDLTTEVAAGHDATERAEAAERERDEMRAKWEPLVTRAAGKEET